MVEVVNRSQQVVSAGLAPASGYSRVVSCGAFLQTAVVYNFGYTPVIADKIWLLGIDVWLSVRNAGDTWDTIFDVTVGQKEPTLWTQVRDWTKLLPIDTRAGFTFWETYNSRAHFHWSFKQRYIKAGQRFGVWGMTHSPDGGIIQASFEISEG